MKNHYQRDELLSSEQQNQILTLLKDTLKTTYLHKWNKNEYNLSAYKLLGILYDIGKEKHYHEFNIARDAKYTLYFTNEYYQARHHSSIPKMGKHIAEEYYKIVPKPKRPPKKKIDYSKVIYYDDKNCVTYNQFNKLEQSNPLHTAICRYLVSKSEDKVIYEEVFNTIIKIEDHYYNTETNEYITDDLHDYFMKDISPKLHKRIKIKTFRFIVEAYVHEYDDVQLYSPSYRKHYSIFKPNLITSQNLIQYCNLCLSKYLIYAKNSHSHKKLYVENLIPLLILLYNSQVCDETLLNQIYEFISHLDVEKRTDTIVLNGGLRLT
jgi:hypothetical protein